MASTASSRAQTVSPCVNMTAWTVKSDPVTSPSLYNPSALQSRPLSCTSMDHNSHGIWPHDGTTDHVGCQTPRGGGRLHRVPSHPSQQRAFLPLRYHGVLQGDKRGNFDCRAPDHVCGQWPLPQHRLRGGIIELELQVIPAKCVEAWAPPILEFGQDQSNDPCAPSHRACKRYNRSQDAVRLRKN